MACNLKLACVLVLCMAAMAAVPVTQARLVGAQVKAKLGECSPYLRGYAGDRPTPACCRGLLAVGINIDDRRDFCNNAKEMYGRDAMVRLDVLPRRCIEVLGINVNVSIDCEALV